MLATLAAPLFNPVKSVATTLTALDTVGFDKRALAAKVDSVLRPDKKVKAAIERSLLSKLVMSTSLDPVLVDRDEASLDEPFFPASSLGNLGFDPLNLGTAETLTAFREAELKHGRLAMLAAIAWPLQEILHPIFVDLMYSTFGVTVPDVLVESNGASPSLVNGGLFQPELFPALALAVLGASVLEERDLNARRARGYRFNEYPNARQAGNFGFDPLNIYRPLSLADKQSLHEAELANSRVAMMAVLAYVGVEAVDGMPVVRATPQVFEPLFLQAGFRAFMDSSFAVASMDGAIDGVAY